MNVCFQLVRVDGTDTLITELTPVSAKKTTNPAPRQITFRPVAEVFFFQITLCNFSRHILYDHPKSRRINK